MAAMVNGIAMTSHRGSNLAVRTSSVLRAAIVACTLCVPATVLAQAPQPPSQAAESPASAPAESNHKPGFIEVFGRWLEDGASKLRTDMREVQEKLDKLGKETREAAKEATGGAVAGLPSARAVTARERCPAAQNGAPDCQTAANVICRGAGFQTGNSLDTQSEQKCPARLLLERRAPNNSECPTEIFVTRAMCQ
jgi:hypothetical protein